MGFGRQQCWTASLLQLQVAQHLACACLPPVTYPAHPPLPPRSNVAEFNRGDLFVIRYRAVQQLLAEGAVELV